MKRTILVTGATDGIGRQTALELARLGHHVWVHGRSPGKVDAVLEALRAEVGGARVDGVMADLSRLREVRALAAEVERRCERLDVLLNNAGVFMGERVETEDGLETTFAVNHLAPFLLTHLLRPLLERSGPARVVTVSSIAHQRGRIDLDDLQLRRGFSGYGAYAQSKLANVLFTLELAERLSGTAVTANCLHPGVVGTKLLAEGFGIDGASTEEGAATSVYLATSAEVEGLTGGYYAHCKPAEVSERARDPQLRRGLWEASEALVGLR